MSSVGTFLDIRRVAEGAAQSGGEGVSVDKIEKAIAQLALLVTRHAAIPSLGPDGDPYAEVREILAKYRGEATN